MTYPSPNDQTHKLEETTRNQTWSKIWFKYQGGCVAASRFKASIHTDVIQPSQSLTKEICYPESNIATSET